jgi:hypothetical protein
MAQTATRHKPVAKSPATHRRGARSCEQPRDGCSSFALLKPEDRTDALVGKLRRSRAHAGFCAARARRGPFGRRLHATEWRFWRCMARSRCASAITPSRGWNSARWTRSSRPRSQHAGSTSTVSATSSTSIPPPTARRMFIGTDGRAGGAGTKGVGITLVASAEHHDISGLTTRARSRARLVCDSDRARDQPLARGPRSGRTVTPGGHSRPSRQPPLM